MIEVDTLWEILNMHGVQRNAYIQQSIEQMSYPAVKTRHGHWILKRRGRGKYRYDDHYCSECNGQAPDNWMDYCARCGAIMDGEIDNSARQENVVSECRHSLR